MMRFLFLIIFVIPVIEIILFVWVGNSLGVWSVIGLIFLTAVLGIALAQYQGLENWRKAQEAWQRGEYPTDYMINSRSEEHTSELQSRGHLVCRLLLEKKN